MAEEIGQNGIDGTIPPADAGRRANDAAPASATLNEQVNRAGQIAQLKKSAGEVGSEAGPSQFENLLNQVGILSAQEALEIALSLVAKDILSLGEFVKLILNKVTEPWTIDIVKMYFDNIAKSTNHFFATIAFHALNKFDGYIAVRDAIPLITNMLKLDDSYLFTLLFDAIMTKADLFTIDPDKLKQAALTGRQKLAQGDTKQTEKWFSEITMYD